MLSYPIVIVGGGVAGLMLASKLADSGLARKTLLIEQNKISGKKLLITGGGRCNYAHLGDFNFFKENYFGDTSLALTALMKYPPESFKAYFEEKGLKTKEEEGRLYPATDKAESIRDLLYENARIKGVQFEFQARLQSLEKEGSDYKISYFSKATKQTYTCLAQRVVLALGGFSYPGTGSDGSFWPFLSKSMNLKVAPVHAALSSLLLDKEECFSELSGLSMNVRFFYNRLLNKIHDEALALKAGIKVDKTQQASKLKKQKVSKEGQLLFTHKGFSGPLVLNTSRDFFSHQLFNEQIDLRIDFLPQLKEGELDTLILQEKEKNPKQSIKAFLKNQLNFSQAFIQNLLLRLNILPNTLLADLSKKERFLLIQYLKSMKIRTFRTDSIKSAYSTAGGVVKSELEIQNFSLKKFPEIHIVGELLNVDASTGGFHIAFAFASANLVADALTQFFKS